LDPALAEDITQDIFLDVLKSMGDFKGLCSNRTWIFKIAKNKLFDFYRKQYRQRIELVDMDGPIAEGLCDPEQDTEKLMESALECQLVCDCLNRIPEHYRITLMLKYVDGKSVKQIAALTNKSLKATESLLQRAKNAFIREYRLSLKKEGLDL
jgi:RNA polymerase sigma-70 factor (ECF subfamily)